MRGGEQPNMKDVSDAAVEAVIDAYPDGAPLEAIGQAMGLTRTRVAQILAGAMTKALRVAQRRGLQAHDLDTNTETTWDRM